LPKVTDSYLQARREQILEAAEACFSRKGLRDTTMQDIADQAGVSYGVLYRYFPSKGDLFRAASIVAEASRDARFQEAAKQPDSIAVLEAVVRLALDRWRDPASTNELRMRLQVLAEAAHDDAFQDFVQEGLDRYWTRFMEIVLHGQRNDEIDADLDPRAVAHLLFALQEGFTEQKAIMPALDIDGYQRLVALVLERALKPRKGEEVHGEGDQADGRD
jgi:AcrR family transcriptional regulator